MVTRSFRIATLACLPFLALMAQTPASWLDPDRSEPAGTRYAEFQSRLAGGRVSYLVYLPPDYRTATQWRYPVVYWLHGLRGDQRGGISFVEQLDRNIRTGKAPAMIAVLVNGMRDSFYCDSPDGKWPIESVIIKEMIPHIDQTYRTIPGRQTRAVEGFSMGGYGAAHLGFKYPEIFGLVGIIAGALVEYDYMASTRANVLQKTFGSDRAYFAANDPATLARKNADAIRGKTSIRIVVGDKDDTLLPRDQAFHELLGQLKIEHEYEVLPGVDHDAGQLYSLLGERAFAFYQKALAPPGRDRPLP